MTTNDREFWDSLPWHTKLRAQIMLVLVQIADKVAR